MGKVLLNVYRCIVGSEYGWSREGNRLWYYFLALEMNCMLTWRLDPKLGSLFTIFSVVHFGMLVLYAYVFMDNLDIESIVPEIVYFSIHLGMIITGLIINWAWTLITIGIVYVGLSIASDSEGYNILSSVPDFGPFKVNHKILIWHTFWFAAFVTVTFLLPTPDWVRFVIIAACMVLHPVMDYLEGECVEVTEITEEAFTKITDKIIG